MNKLLQKASILSVLSFTTINTLTATAFAQDSHDNDIDQADAAAGGTSNNLLGIGKNDFGKNFTTFSSPGAAINSAINIVLIVAGLAAFMYILWGAFNYVTAGDDPGKTEKARRTITNAVVGLVLVALSFVIWSIVTKLTGLESLF